MSIQINNLEFVFESRLHFPSFFLNLTTIRPPVSMNSSDPTRKVGNTRFTTWNFYCSAGTENSGVGLQNGVQITVELDCTLAHRVNTTQRTQHIFLGNPQYSMPMRFYKLECRDFLLININVSWIYNSSETVK